MLMAAMQLQQTTTCVWQCVHRVHRGSVQGDSAPSPTVPRCVESKLPFSAHTQLDTPPNSASIQRLLTTAIVNA
jgi:hypothetical protein